MTEDTMSLKRKVPPQVEDGPTPSKDAKVMRMMKNMGYTMGSGLGKTEQGRVEPVASSLQTGRRGFGHRIKGFEREDVDWEQEEVILEEEVTWLPQCTYTPPDLDTMRGWKQIGEKKEIIDDEDQFCSQEILTAVLSMKSQFDNLEPEQMRRARTRSNPYETIRGGFFLNRAAMKMANMDAALDFMFTNPKDENGRELYPISDHHHHHPDLLYFADICAGPGGFSEYILWRRKGDVKGFGFTLKNQNDFKLTDFHAGPCEMFEPHYGVGGSRGDGDIYQPSNQAAFKNFVLQHTNNKGVNFVLADGGFSVEGEENIQEIRSKRLYLCQCLMALLVLRPGGHFLCKLFDLFTRFSVGLVYLMYRSFDQVSIIKPVTSRPANSERYIVCRGMRADCNAIREYMHEINLDLDKYLKGTSDLDVTDVVSMDVISGDAQFLDYIIESNESIAEAQVINLKKIQAYAKNPDLYESRQADIRKACFSNWQVPMGVRSVPPVNNPSERYEALAKCMSQSTYAPCPTPISPHTLNSIKSLYDYRCIVTSSPNKMLILGLGRTNVYWWDGSHRRRWQKLGIDESDVNSRIKFNLPCDTLIEAVICDEFSGEGSGQRRMKSVHVVDAYVLYGIDISHFSYPERRARLEKFLTSIHKPTRSDLSQVKMTSLYRLEHLHEAFTRLHMKKVKKAGVSLKAERLCYCLDEENYFYPAGVFFIKFVSEPWMMAWSRSQQRKYYYNTDDRRSLFDTPPDSIASTAYCNGRTLLWSWENDAVMSDTEGTMNGDVVVKSHMMSYLAKLK